MYTLKDNAFGQEVELSISEISAIRMALFGYIDDKKKLIAMCEADDTETSKKALYWQKKELKAALKAMSKLKEI